MFTSAKKGGDYNTAGRTPYQSNMPTSVRRSKQEVPPTGDNEDDSSVDVDAVSWDAGADWSVKSGVATEAKSRATLDSGRNTENGVPPPDGMTFASGDESLYSGGDSTLNTYGNVGSLVSGATFSIAGIATQQDMDASLYTSKGPPETTKAKDKMASPKGVAKKKATSSRAPVGDGSEDDGDFGSFYMCMGVIVVLGFAFVIIVGVGLLLGWGDNEEESARVIVPFVPALPMTLSPTMSPTLFPTAAPSLSPVETAGPTIPMTLSPTTSPTTAPSLSPVETEEPTTTTPTTAPSLAPSALVQISSSSVPSDSPSTVPSSVPSTSPSVAPSVSPVTLAPPEDLPTVAPTSSNTEAASTGASDVSTVETTSAGSLTNRNHVTELPSSLRGTTLPSESATPSDTVSPSDTASPSDTISPSALEDTLSPSDTAVPTAVETESSHVRKRDKPRVFR